MTAEFLRDYAKRTAFDVFNVERRSYPSTASKEQKVDFLYTILKKYIIYTILKGSEEMETGNSNYRECSKTKGWKRAGKMFCVMRKKMYKKQGGFLK